MSNEADTCRKYVVPRLQEAGWDAAPYSIAEQRTFTDGRVRVVAGRARRGDQKRADYLLRYRRDFAIAVVEAKPDYKLPSDGLQQARDYANILGLKFAYATNGKGIVEFDFLSGKETAVEAFPCPAELWSRLKAAEPLDETATENLLTPYFDDPEKEPLLPADRHQPGRRSRRPRQETHSAHHGHGDGKNGRRVSNLLEALVGPLERRR